MSSSYVVAVDAMGGDIGPRLCVPACLKFLQAHPEARLILTGNDSLLASELARYPELQKRVRIEATEQEVAMGELPGVAFRHKRASSMWRALELVAQGEANACVSAGNTGALMAMSRHLIKTMDGMSRPAICKPIPTVTGSSYLLDMGANLDCSPEQLLQFAIMGTALAKVNGIDDPSVALLNVGAETTKGNQEIKQAYSLMEENAGLNFKGFVEGNNLFSGLVDVVVCDGFVGNVALKASEGAATFILDSLRQEFSKGFFRKMLGALNYQALKGWRKRFSPSSYNGAALLGLNKIVVKSHGGATGDGFYLALETALQQVKAEIPQRLSDSLAKL